MVHTTVNFSDGRIMRIANTPARLEQHLKVWRGMAENNSNPWCWQPHLNTGSMRISSSLPAMFPTRTTIVLGRLIQGLYTSGWACCQASVRLVLHRGAMSSYIQLKKRQASDGLPTWSTVGTNACMRLRLLKSKIGSVCGPDCTHVRMIAMHPYTA